ncbi:hypothetical protein KGQ27_00635 [Patescibacteria group bacterium]|nr:hypothetical protein [Patescibacteria group bacterium]MDE2010673.1 hypothetical protein [Patescibacteria group bacterium]
MKPNPDNGWESLKVYNPGAIFHEGKYHLFYRAVGKSEDAHSAIGYATSVDGEHFDRYPKPILDREEGNPLELRGLEDPRITKIGDTFYMAYAAYDGKLPRLCTAESKDLAIWHKQGIAFKNFDFISTDGRFWGLKGEGKFRVNAATKKQKNNWSKSGAIFPEKINNKYWMIFNDPTIWIANSDDAINWNLAVKEPLIYSRTSTDLFDNLYVEVGPPPIKTNRGWFVMYHGINELHQYQLGFVLLELNNPLKVIYRSSGPIFGPREEYELGGMVDIVPGVMDLIWEGDERKIKLHLKEAEAKGFMPQVAFVPAAVLVDGNLRLFYGAGDQYICTATARIDDILATIDSVQA